MTTRKLIKPRPIKTDGMIPGEGVRLALIDGPRPYIRLESEVGEYLGCIPDRRVADLAKWCRRAAQKLSRGKK